MGQEDTLHGTVPAQMGMLNYSRQKVGRQSASHNSVLYCVAIEVGRPVRCCLAGASASALPVGTMSARATLFITAVALLAGCAALTPRSAVGMRCGSRPPLRALRLQGGSSEEDEEVAAESDCDPVDDPDEDSEGEAPEVEEPDDEGAEPAPVSAASARSSSGSLVRSMLSSLGLVPSKPSGEGVAEGEAREQDGDMMSTLITVAVFVAFRVLLSLAMRFFGRAAAEGGVTPMEQMVAALGSSPLGPLVKAVQQGWASMAELARSPWAAPVVMSLMIVALKLVGSMEAEP